MSEQNKKKVVKATTVAVASKDLKEVAIGSKPENEANFVELNTAKKVKLKDDDRDKGNDQG